MLQFIVLGIIPGTTIQLTFNDIMLLASGVFGVYAVLEYVRYRMTRRAVQQLMFSLIAL